VILDLESDEGWAKVMDGCDFLLHLASPYPFKSPKDENEIIFPAVNGTNRVLRYAKKSNIKRVIVTSSVAAISFGHSASKNTFDHNDWTKIESSSKVNAYIKSKTLAEQAAWDFISQENNNNIKLTTVNPSAVFGPPVGENITGTSMDIIKQFITGKFPACPNISFSLIDVRDVAKIHLECLENEDSINKRIICSHSTSIKMSEIGRILNTNGFSKSPDKNLPDILVKALALINREMREMKVFLGVETNFNISQTKEIFDWQPISIEQSLLESAHSIMDIINKK
tara:strand:- start:585 stop:1436 length:852 start_codon:yes stop_codon:yes gene_type:complete